jgi:Ca2+-binding EF-hand superfamily protein
VTSFKNYDKDNNGVMDKNEFKEALKDMGYRDLTDARIS